MIELTIFEAALDNAELDPRPRWKVVVRRAIERGLAGVPANTADSLVQKPLFDLTRQLITAFEQHSYADGETAITRFSQELLHLADRERQPGGRLAPHTPVDEVKKHSEELHDKLWRSAEQASLRALLQPGEIIRSITVRTIETDRRGIDRQLVRNALRPVWFRESWGGQYVGEDALRNLESTLIN